MAEGWAACSAAVFRPRPSPPTHTPSHPPGHPRRHQLPPLCLRRRPGRRRRPRVGRRRGLRAAPVARLCAGAVAVQGRVRGGGAVGGPHRDVPGAQKRAQNRNFGVGLASSDSSLAPHAPRLRHPTTPPLPPNRSTGVPWGALHRGGGRPGIRPRADRGQRRLRGWVLGGRAGGLTAWSSDGALVSLASLSWSMHLSGTGFPRRVSALAWPPADPSPCQPSALPPTPSRAGRQDQLSLVRL